MKKIFKNAAFLAFGLGMMVSFTACHQGEDAKVNLVPVSNVVKTSASTIMEIQLNVPATVTIGGKPYTTDANNVIRIEDGLKSGTIVIVPKDANRLYKELTFDFGESTYLAYDITLELPAEAPVAQNADGTAAGEVKNTADNQSVTGVSADVDFNGGGNTNTSVTDGYSITVYQPAADEAEALKKNDEVDEPVLGVRCKPDGAEFANPIYVNLNIPASEGYDMDVVYVDANGNVKSAAEDGNSFSIASRDGNKVKLAIKHFSDYEITLKATVTDVATRETSKTYTAAADKGEVAYAFDYGYETTETGEFINKYLKKTFGTSKKNNIAKKVTFTPVKGGTAKLTVTQTIKDVTISTTYGSETKIIKATMYGDIKEKLDIEAPEEVAPEIKTHSGGASE